MVSQLLPKKHHFYVLLSFINDFVTSIFNLQIRFLNFILVYKVLMDWIFSYFVVNGWPL